MGNMLSLSAQSKNKDATCKKKGKKKGIFLKDKFESKIGHQGIYIKLIYPLIINLNNLKDIYIFLNNFIRLFLKAKFGHNKKEKLRITSTNILTV